MSFLPRSVDVVVLGAGAAGLMAAAVAGRRGRSVLVLDHAGEAGRKILISGGGRCNFTNLATKPENFLSANRHFARSALSRYTPRDFLALVERHRIGWHEKAKDQLFCDGSAREIVRMLLDECAAAGCVVALETRIRGVTKGERFRVETDRGDVEAESVVLATGGLSIPKLGATDLSLRVARRFGLEVVETAPALVPFTLPDMGAIGPDLAGVSLNVAARIGKVSFEDGMVFTHRGVSGPAVLQISSYWREGEVVFDLLPGRDAEAALLEVKARRPRGEARGLLSELVPTRLAHALARVHGLPEGMTLANLPDRRVREVAAGLRGWRVSPSGTEGYVKAEVMRGGIDTRGLSSQTMEAREVRGLYAVGEAVDVTGWLGGYNFQWAWASGHAAGMAV